jgi:hypothetical protein
MTARARGILCGRPSARDYVPSDRGMVAEAIHVLQDVMSPSLQAPRPATVDTGTAFPSTNETEK